MFDWRILTILLAFVGSVSAADYRLPDGEQLTDPTRPSGWRAAPAGKSVAQVFTLNYVINTDSRRQAMINGQKVEEGGRVNGARVLRINEDSVVVSVNGQQQTLRINAIKGFRKSP